jgi:hypothetical protein
MLVILLPGVGEADDSLLGDWNLPTEDLPVCFLHILSYIFWELGLI